MCVVVILLRHMMMQTKNPKQVRTHLFPDNAAWAHQSRSPSFCSRPSCSAAHMFAAIPARRASVASVSASQSLEYIS